MMAGVASIHPVDGNRPLILRALLALDPRVRSVVQVGIGGEQLASVSRDGLESLEPESETTTVLNQTAIGAGMGFSMNRYHGKVRAVIVVREKLSLVVFPLFDELILISADPDFPLERCRDMARMIDEFYFDCSPGVTDISVGARA